LLSIGDKEVQCPEVFHLSTEVSAVMRCDHPKVVCSSAEIGHDLI